MHPLSHRAFPSGIEVDFLQPCLPFRRRTASQALIRLSRSRYSASIPSARTCQAHTPESACTSPSAAACLALVPSRQYQRSRTLRHFFGLVNRPSPRVVIGLTHIMERNDQGKI